jgi:hypothetical protein
MVRTIREMRSDISIANEVWIALATLHRSNSRRESFSTREIMEQIRREKAHPLLRPGVQWNISLHMVANLAPNPAKLRMLYRLPDGSYRLYRPGDDVHPRRTGKTQPERAELPEKYRDLLSWYRSSYCSRPPAKPNFDDDPVLRMRGVGKEVWADIDADKFVRDLRANWYGKSGKAGKPVNLYGMPEPATRKQTKIMGRRASKRRRLG